MTWRYVKDRFATRSMTLVLVFANSLAFLVALGLYVKSRPILAQNSLWNLIFDRTWQPLSGKFGFFSFIVGTVEVTLIAMVIAVPTCLLAAVYLSEYSGRRFREGIRIVVDLMAGIPSVIYGLFGVIAIVPLTRELGQALGHPTTGYSLLAGGIILAIMVAPIIVSVATEVLRTVPLEARETALALGVTRWETVKHVLFKSARHGLISAVVLGFARAFGETMAVLMVMGNVARVPHSVFDPAYSLPALIANNYGEMMSIPLYDSALMLAALILMVVVGGFHLAAHVALYRIEKRS
jgi:phosphate transport system permease protein